MTMTLSIGVKTVHGMMEIHGIFMYDVFGLLK